MKHKIRPGSSANYLSPVPKGQGSSLHQLRIFKLYNLGYTMKQAKTNNLWEARASDKPIKLAGHVKQWVWWWSECRFLRGVFFHQSTLVGIFKFCPKIIKTFFILIK